MPPFSSGSGDGAQEQSILDDDDDDDDDDDVSSVTEYTALDFIKSNMPGCNTPSKWRQSLHRI